jgi:hypothetical protein
VSTFLLSPGITPELTDVFVIGVPLAVGLGGLLFGRRGLEVAFGASAVALGAIKFATDLTDLGDDLVALGATLGGLGWVFLALRPMPRGRLFRALVVLFGVFAVVVGLIKIRDDFYDPFDLLLADTSIVAGVAWILYGRGARGGPAPDSPPGKHPG